MPIGAFLLGDGERREKDARFWRNFMTVGVGVAVVTNLIASFIWALLVKS